MDQSKQKYKIALREGMRPDYTIDQRWDNYSKEDHAVWRELFNNLMKMLPGSACNEFMDGLNELQIVADEVPKFEELNKVLGAKTGWEIVAVAGAVPGSVFFDHLANRRFPATDWIRSREQMEYLEEPDVFHDIFGHVPMLMNPIFADYMAAYGRGGVKAKNLKGIRKIGRLYWYTVEFGLINTPEGMRIYGAGILSSTKEAKYSLDSDIPNRIGFDVKRIMQTDFNITDLQELYFVIDDFEQLFDATRPDFTPYYAELQGKEMLHPRRVLDTDQVFTRGKFTD